MSEAGSFDCFAPGGGMVSVAEALALLERSARPLAGVEQVPLDRALGRLLARPLSSPRDVPAFDNVAVDGFAFLGSALAADGPSRLRIVAGRAAAGHPFAGALASGEAVRALTGAPMPEGADTVAMWEEVEVEGDALAVPAGFRAGANRRRAGEDVRQGQTLFAPGLRLLPQHLGVAAELGLAELPVFRRLRVALCSSGDELCQLGTALPHGGVFDANRPILKACLATLPVEVTDLGILPDQRERTAAILHEAAGAHELLLASGGASKGEADHVVRCVAERGGLDFWQIRMKPGRPLATGRLGDAWFAGVPGNPVAATVCFLLFVRPLILRLAGGGWTTPRRYAVPAGFAMRKRPGRTELLRATLVPGADGRPVARRIMREGSGILTSLTEAHGLVEIGEDVARIEPGEPVPFLSWAELGLG